MLLRCLMDAHDGGLNQLIVNIWTGVQFCEVVLWWCFCGVRIFNILFYFVVRFADGKNLLDVVCVDCKLTWSLKLCITSARITSVTTRTSRITKNCKTEKKLAIKISVQMTFLSWRHSSKTTDPLWTHLLTTNRRQRCSLRAPRQPRNPVTMVIPPATSRRLAAKRDGKDWGREDRSACVKDSQTPTPNKPHPPSF